MPLSLFVNIFQTVQRGQESRQGWGIRKCIIIILLPLYLCSPCRAVWASPPTGFSLPQAVEPPDSNAQCRHLGQGLAPTVLRAVPNLGSGKANPEPALRALQTPLDCWAHGCWLGVRRRRGLAFNPFRGAGSILSTAVEPQLRAAVQLAGGTQLTTEIPAWV